MALDSRPVVMKFGGTSATDADAIRRVLEIVRASTQAGDGPFAAVACKRNVTMVEITSTRMLMAHGFLHCVFEVFERFATSVDVGMAILSAVGDNLRTNPRLAARIIGALESFPVRMVSQAASRRNVTIVLSEEDLASAMERLHEEFFAQTVRSAEL